MPLSRIEPPKHCYILFMDVVGFSLVEDNVTQFNTVRDIYGFVENYLEQNSIECIRILTGDGMALVFTEDKYALEPLKLSIKLQNFLSTERKKIPIRFGINNGLNYVISDEQGNKNVVGANMNVAARVMSCGEENHILLSDSYYNAVVQGNREYPRYCKLLGKFKVKHEKDLTLYNCFSLEQGFGNEAVPEKMYSISEKVTPETFRQEYDNKKKQIDDLIKSFTTSLVPLDDTAKATKLESTGDEYKEWADIYWSKSDLPTMYRCGWYYALAAYAYENAGPRGYEPAGWCYHFAGHRFRYLEEYEQAAKLYKSSAECFEKIKSRDSYMRARRAYRRSEMMWKEVGEIEEANKVEESEKRLEL